MAVSLVLSRKEGAIWGHFHVLKPGGGSVRVCVFVYVCLQMSGNMCECDVCACVKACVRVKRETSENNIFKPRDCAGIPTCNPPTTEASH